MRKIIIVVLAMLIFVCIAYASEGDEYKGSFSGYDVSAENAVLKMIESQTDPKTERVEIDGMSLKFDYFDNNFFLADGYMVGGAHFSDNKDRYVFDYYVEGDKVVKIVLYTKNNVVILKQVYPTKDEAGSDGRK